jgi:phenylacetate-CoA ligase
VYLWGAPVGHVSRRQSLKTQAYDAVYRQRVINTFSQSAELWSEVYRTIQRIRPTLVVGYVSSLEQFAGFLSQRQLTLPQVRAIIAAAEPLHAAERDAIQSALGAPVFNTYGSREFMSIAAECERRDGLHVHAENLVVETSEPGRSEPSEILVTDLHNYGMPFVRYAIGDAGSIVDGPCSCGRGLPRLGMIDGRVLDLLRTADGRTVPGEFFPHLLKDVPEFAQFRVEQPRPDALVLSVVLNAPLSDRSQSLLDHEIGKVFGSATRWEIRPVAHLPKLPSGKRRVTVGLAG